MTVFLQKIFHLKDLECFTFKRFRHGGAIDSLAIGWQEQGNRASQNYLKVPLFKIGHSRPLYLPLSINKCPKNIPWLAVPVTASLYLLPSNAGNLGLLISVANDLARQWTGKNHREQDYRHSSVDLSAPSIMLPRVQVASTPYLFFQFILLNLYICHLNWNVKWTKINKKRPGLAH